MNLAGLGIDAVDVPRFRAALDRRPTLTGRLFTDQELAYAGAAKDPTQRLAVRFAAKEAVMKSLGVGMGEVSFTDIEVVRDASSGTPSLRLAGRAASLAAEQLVAGWRLSLTHTDQVAIAVVAAETGVPAGQSAETGVPAGQSAETGVPAVPSEGSCFRS